MFKFPLKLNLKWYFVTKIVLAYCEKKSSDRENVLISLVQFLKPCMHLVEIFSQNNVTVRHTKIMNRADKNYI